MSIFRIFVMKTYANLAYTSLPINAEYEYGGLTSLKSSAWFGIPHRLLKSPPNPGPY